MILPWTRTARVALVTAAIAVTIFGCTPSPDASANATPGASVTANELDRIENELDEKGPAVAGVLEIEEVREGEGESIDGAGAFKAVMKVWEDDFDGQPFGQGELEMMVVAGIPDLEGLEEAAEGMKKDGVRRIKINAQKLFGEVPAEAPISPDKLFFIELTVADIYPEEPFEIVTVTEGQGDQELAEGVPVRLHYVGRLDSFEDGKVFESSRERGAPMTVVPGQNRVIPGWEKGLLGMKKGEVRQLRIPHYLAYGDREQGEIPPLSTLFFEIELVDFIEAGELKTTTTKEGEGEAIASGDRGSFHYTGWTDGFDGQEKFDSSRDRGTPIEVTLGAGQVIQGWDQGLVGMKQGEVRRLEIPYNLAYGEDGRPPVIPGFATLFFDVEYVSWMGRNWKVVQVEIRQHPRVQIRIGGVWNGPVAAPPAP